MDKLLSVDREVEKVYIKLLRKSLEHIEEWETFEHYSNKYKSPYINDNGVYFVTDGSSYNPLGIIHIYVKNGSSNHELHKINISFWDGKTRKMLKKLNKFMPNKNKWEKSRNITNKLKELLGIEFDRYAKIMKIKKKL